MLGQRGHTRGRDGGRCRPAAAASTSAAQVPRSKLSRHCTAGGGEGWEGAGSQLTSILDATQHVRMLCPLAGMKTEPPYQQPALPYWLPTAPPSCCCCCSCMRDEATKALPPTPDSCLHEGPPAAEAAGRCACGHQGGFNEKGAAAAHGVCQHCGRRAGWTGQGGQACRPGHRCCEAGVQA